MYNAILKLDLNIYIINTAAPVQTSLHVQGVEAVLKCIYVHNTNNKWRTISQNLCINRPVQNLNIRIICLARSTLPLYTNYSMVVSAQL